MRKMMMAALAASIALPVALQPVAASAQSYREVRDSQRDLRREQQDLRQAQRYGSRQDIREQRRDVKQARKELREDWRDYRRSHREVYRRDAYRGPSGYRYRPVNVGYRFAPSYYGRGYWVNDYRRYRLASPGYNNRWVRYGNDVVLVNIRTGRVLQVYSSFFW